MNVAVIGLGEAGRPFAEHLAARTELAAFDAFPHDLGESRIRQAPTVAAAVAQAGLVLAFVPAEAALDALLSAMVAMSAGSIYVDLATAGPALKREAGERASEAGVEFVDGAIMESVTGPVARVPLLLSGGAAEMTASVLRGWGLRADVAAGPLGAASARKLVRSIAVKGLTAAFVEATRAAEAEGILEWWEGHREGVVEELDAAKLDRYLVGTLVHHGRRVHEIEAAAQMEEEHGQSALIARATVATLKSIASFGIPGVQVAR